MNVTAYLINSAWQIPLLFVCTAGLLKVIPKAETKLHYRLWVACLIVCVALPAFPALISHIRFNSHSSSSTVIKAQGQPEPMASENGRIAIYSAEIAEPSSKDRAREVLLWLYVLSLLAGTIKLFSRVKRTNEIVKSANRMALPPSASNSLVQAAKAIGIAPVCVYSSSIVQCPAAVSWPKPMLIVPEDFSSLPEDVAVAAISHELAHIRRHDFEINLVYEVISLIAFYHPAMHWIKKRIEESREILCDEMAADAMMGRTGYAKSLLILAQTVSAPTKEALSLGVLGTSAIEKRIMRLIDSSPLPTQPYRLFAAACSWSLLAGLCISSVAISNRFSMAQAVSAQFKAPPLEVASVKQVKESGGWQSFGLTADGLNVTNAEVRILIRMAFAAMVFDSNQIVGEPSWHAERYDIKGKVSDADVEKLRNLTNLQSSQMFHAMLQTILADRFKMKVHQENREGPVFELVVVQSGTKLKATPQGDTNETDEIVLGTNMGPGVSGGDGKLMGHRVSSEQLAEALQANGVGRTVIDKTGLTGKYDFTLSWTPTPQTMAPGLDSGVAADSAETSIFTAIREQLGLKLVPAKGPVKTLVIDHIERPSEN